MYGKKEFIQELFEKSQELFEKLAEISNDSNLNKSMNKNIDNIENLIDSIQNLDIENFEQLINRIATNISKMDRTYLEAIKIKNYFSIKDIEITDLKDKKEIYFVGENGDGKTILLQAIALALKGKDKDYSKLAYDYIEEIKDRIELSTIDEKFPLEYRNYKNVKNLFAYGINRTQPLCTESA
jgi:DNA replication protein DnaC